MTADANRRGILGTSLLSLLCVFGVGAGPVNAPRNTPRGLKDATLLGHEDPARPVSIILTLDLRDHAGADALIAAQQDPSSPLYHQWIAPEEFQARFGPLSTDLDAAAAFLQAQGFTGISPPRPRWCGAKGPSRSPSAPSR
jgi:hypothetical protein